MNVVFLCLIMLILAGIRLRPGSGREAYIDIESVQPIKGVFILLVFASHFFAYIQRIPASDSWYLAVRGFLGQMIVVPFFFYSGYGVCKSIQLKGAKYLSEFPIRRIMKVTVQFMVAVFIYVMATPITGVSLRPWQIVLSFVGWTSAGNSNWYIFAVVILYVLTWLSFALFNRDKISNVHSLTILSCLTLLLVDILSYCRPDYVYNTLFAYVAGCWFSVLRPQFEKLVERFAAYILILLSLVTAFCMLRMEGKSTSACEAASVAFAMILVMFSMKIRLNSPILSFCGRQVFGIYVFQRLPMWIFKGTAVASNRYVYFCICLALTFVFSVVFDFAFSRVWNIGLSFFEKAAGRHGCAIATAK